ncbi:MAG: TetR/AcrR family transcriptional regulator [Clostridiales bacterium]|nr:TetR/AcrR family transcriptional regulator [Clostridiales bacterium]
MNRSQSKYFNTALLMDQALLLLLEKKDLEFITVKEICQKAGVNRSTFYLHYENINDLFKEAVEMLNKDFQNSFRIKDIRQTINNGDPEDAVFIRPEYLIPYLEFVKRNKRVLKMIHDKPIIFKNDLVYKQMKEEVFYPVLLKFNVKKEDWPYKLEFFTRGVVGIISQWLEDDCRLSEDKIAELIIDCVGFSKK